MIIHGACRDTHRTDRQGGGQGRRGERRRKGEEESKVGSEDESEGGSIPLSDPSGRVTSAEEECRVDGERMKNKQKDHKARQKG